MAECSNKQKCSCTYSGCERHGRCCECLSYPLRSRELPACCFPPAVEKTYDRSIKKFVEINSERR